MLTPAAFVWTYCEAGGGAHLDVSAGVNLVHRVPRGAASLAVQVVALHEDGVVAQAAHPHVPLTFTLQLHAFADVKP